MVAPSLRARMIRALLLAAFAVVATTCDRSPLEPERQSPPPPPGAPLPALGPDDTTVVLVGAGDIARCDSQEDEATAALLDNIPGIVFTVGDNVYAQSNITPDFVNCYNPSWGRHKARTRPAHGHMESWQSGSTNYYDYFGAAAGEPGKGYYSYDAGAWHVVVLNSKLSMALGSAQDIWLNADLAARTKPCLLAIWHHPRFSSAGSTPVDALREATWDALYAAGASLVLNSHYDVYERFAPQRPDGSLDPDRGIRQFTVGTGGISYNAFRSPPMPNSEVRNNNTHGVLKLTLRPDGYDWQFVPQAGKTFTDAGSGPCFGAEENLPPVARPGGPYVAENAVTFDGSASSDPDGNLPLSFLWDFGDGATGTGPTPTHTYAVEAVYTVTLTVTDARGGQGVATTTATIQEGPPTVDAGSDHRVRPGVPARLTFAFTDKDANDGPWAYDVAWGEGAHTTGTATVLGQPIEVTHAYGATGSFTVPVSVTDKDGATGVDQVTITVSPPGTPTTFAGAGNIASCGNDRDEATAALLDALPGLVFALGDNAFPNGSAIDYADCYHPTWGRHRDRTRPVQGNHEYQSAGAAPSYAYWGVRAGPAGLGYYSYDIDDWHVVVLNDQIPFTTGTPQYDWLLADLAANAKLCTIAMWHVPLYLSSNEAGYFENSSRRPLWEALYAAGADIVLNAQQHHYERFAPMTPAGAVDNERGIREFNVGTGGESVGMPTVIHPNSQVRSIAFGVLKLTLNDGFYSWEFVPMAGETFTDAGSGSCGVEVPNQPPTAVPGGPYASEGPVTFDGTGSSDPDGNLPLTYAWDFGDGATGTGATPAHTYGGDGLYTVTLTVTDSRGASGAAVTTTATIGNAPPAVSAGPDAGAVQGLPFTLNASFADASGDAPWNYTIAWGDGQTTPGSASAPGAITAQHSYASLGQFVVQVSVTDKDGGTGSDDATVTVAEPTAVLVGAGDIAECGSSGHPATANLLDGIPGTVFTAGDNAYNNGSLSDYMNCYDPTWGRHKARTRPSPGNHEYNTPGASGYFSYYGELAGPAGRGYYSYDLGAWHVISLSSSIDMDPGSPQDLWLRADLAANQRLCTIAYFHHPRFSSGSNHGSWDGVQPFWEALYEAGADVVISGHDHLYERFAPQTPDGDADPQYGIRQFTVGTGGAGLYNFGPPLPNSEARNSVARGLIKLTLRASGYDWQFVPIAGQTYTDQGSASCHGAPGEPPPNTPPTAAFSSSCTDLACTFTDQSTDAEGSIASRSWTFGDGATSTAQNPAHAYAAGGTYTVSLTVTDGGGAQATTQQAVTVAPPNTPPTAAFGASCTDLACSFTDQSSDAEGPIAAWSWTFGDGATATTQNPAHTYAAGGSYTVTLTVTDGAGAPATTQQVVNPTPGNSTPVAAFTSSCTDLACTFTDQSSDAEGPIAAWAWDFGDGATATTQNATHTYAAGGSYTVSLTVTDGAGAPATTQQVVTVTPPNAPPTAAFAFSCTALACDFTDQSGDAEGPIAAWSWSFGDGGTATTPNSTHTYATGGTYTVTLTVTDGAGAPATTQQTVTVNASPVAGFAASCAFLACAFTDQSSDLEGPIASWSWSFGDGATATTQNPTHTYAAGGSYTVTLTVTDGMGAQATAQQVVNANTAPTAAFAFTCTGLACTFTDQSTDAEGPLAARSWTFGDGATATTQNPAHTYATGGSYTVTLTVTDAAGAQGTTQRQVTVDAPPVADFAVSCTLLSCTFTDQSTDPEGPIAVWSWTFGDGATSTTQHPVHTYAAAASYTVTLTVTDGAGAQATTQRTVAVGFFTTWIAEPSGTTRDLEATWGQSATDFYAVGRSGTILRWNGSAWSTVTVGFTQNLFAVGGTGPSDVYAVGANGRVAHFNGAAWTWSQVSSTKWSGVWGTSPSHVFIVGGGGAIRRYDGSTWTLMPTGVSKALDDIWGASATDVYAVGDGGTILHFDGAVWSIMASGTTRNLNAIWGSSSSDIFAGGGAGVIRHFDGTSWAPMTTGVTDAIMGIWGASATEVYAATSTGRILRYDGVSWAIVATPGGNPRGLWGVPNAVAYVVGAGGAIVRGSP